MHRAVLPSVVRSCFRWPGCVTQNVDCAVLVKLIWARFCLQIRILCGVDHEDLKRLFNVSKMFREAVSVNYVILIECCDDFFMVPFKQTPLFIR